MSDGPRYGSSSTASTRARPWLPWIVVPAALGVFAGMAAAMLPWGRKLLAFAMVVSGLAWVLRVASDWFAERAGPQQGVVILGSILFGTWLVLAMSAPEPLRRLGFGSVNLTQTERDPYALRPAGSRSPLQSLQNPSSEPIDPLPPLKALITRDRADPDAAAPNEREAPTPPTDGRRSVTSTALRLSSSRSVEGEGVVLMAEVKGDGRAVHGTIDFRVNDSLVASVPLRVQGETSQAEYRLRGLKAGLYDIRAAYRGSRSFEPGASASLPHRVGKR